MRRRERTTVSPFLEGGHLPRLITMIVLLLVLGLMYSQARDPRNWRWLAGDTDVPSEETPEIADSQDNAPPETIVPGPTDQDAAETAAASQLFEALSDRSPLEALEMPAYWRCLKWARAQSFADLERRADQNVVYRQLWEQPDKYRGKLLRLRLHLRQVVDFEAQQNPAGIQRVYEAWGATDESKSHPYVVVFTDLPTGMTTGANVQEEAVFVGYFLKTMSYTASDTARAAPLLAGRMRRIAVPSPAPSPNARGVSEWLWVAAAGLALLGAFVAFRQLFRVRQPRAILQRLPSSAPFRAESLTPADAPPEADSVSGNGAADHDPSA